MKYELPPPEFFLAEDLPEARDALIAGIVPALILLALICAVIFLIRLHF